MAGELHVAREGLAQISVLRRGRVRLAAYPSAAATLVPRALAALVARHPDVEVLLTEAEPPEAVALLEAGEVDVALVFGYDADPGAGRTLAWSRLSDEPVLLVVPPGHRLAERPGLDARDGSAAREACWLLTCCGG